MFSAPDNGLETRWRIPYLHFKVPKSVFWRWARLQRGKGLTTSETYREASMDLFWIAPSANWCICKGLCWLACFEFAVHWRSVVLLSSSSLWHSIFCDFPSPPSPCGGLYMCMSACLVSVVERTIVWPERTQVQNELHTSFLPFVCRTIYGQNGTSTD